MVRLQRARQNSINIFEKKEDEKALKENLILIDDKKVNT